MNTQLPPSTSLADRCDQADESRVYDPFSFDLAEARLACR